MYQSQYQIPSQIQYYSYNQSIPYQQYSKSIYYNYSNPECLNNSYIDTSSILESLSKLESCFDADVVIYYGSIHSQYISHYQRSLPKQHSNLVIILNSDISDINSIKQIIDINKFYKHVTIIVPCHVKSAGIALVLSANTLYMDYLSGITPIDTHIFDNKANQFISAFAYIDAIKKLTNTSLNAQLVSPRDILFAQECRLHQKQIKSLIKSFTNNDTVKQLSNMKRWISYDRACINIDILKSLNINVINYESISIQTIIRSIHMVASMNIYNKHLNISLMSSIYNYQK